MAQYHCNYCQTNILDVRVRCAECDDFDLCLQCFSCGAEVGIHRKDHKYQVIDNGSFSVFTPETQKWTAVNESMLLDGVEHFGFGNWEDIAEQVGHSTPEECCEHYFTFYVKGNIGKATLPNENTTKITDHTGPDSGPLSPSLTTPLPSVDIPQNEQQELGYMPLRDDFEREYDNDAETLVSNLSLNYDDEDVDNSK
ncbi:transcriptional adapter 2-beta-like [Lingula anatina]|uniref:Transcriptional adapter 2-beta-like n=1 Tax=Lingula anatina TaxID=7574 RepID=A0A1S3JA69_LINAN|nr:transcriptional adapter 2-beta-like [Lingula anatina]|eukprot:XP_013407297.1 transcriptional adapter 2-beta-like [Lingula anatina]